MIVKTIARKTGLNPSSNGQLMKTALEGGGGLTDGGFATRLAVLHVQRIANGLSRGRAFPAHRGELNLNAAIDDRAFAVRRRTRPSGPFYCRYHGHNMELTDCRRKLRYPSTWDRKRCLGVEYRSSLSMEILSGRIDNLGVGKLMAVCASASSSRRWRRGRSEQASPSHPRRSCRRTGRRPLLL